MAAAPQAAELEAMLQTAVSHHRAGRLPEAERIYRDILQVLPDHPVVNNSLGIALKGQGKTEEAAAVFSRLASVAADYAPAHSNLGNILFEQRKLQEAETCYRRALAVNPNMVDALKNLGLVIVDSGRFEESFPWFRRHAELAYGTPGSTGQTPPHKAKHDQEQRDYLAQIAGGAASAFRLAGKGRQSRCVPGRDCAALAHQLTPNCRYRQSFDR
jgi:tetratricopeptide (TPR) repeat protein